MPHEIAVSNYIEIDHHKCRRCSYCIQVCPAKAIKREKDTVRIIAERCLLCGNCIEECPHQALRYGKDLNEVRELLSADSRTIACLDPSFPTVFASATPRQLVTALKRLGFTEVWEGAFGAELVSWAYRKLLTLEGIAREIPTYGQIESAIISSFCPVIVSYIQKFSPTLIPRLAPIVSPMIAIGRVAKFLKGSRWEVFYLSPCLAQMGESSAPEVAGAIDHVVTFRRVKRLLADAAIRPQDLDETDFDGPIPYMGRVVCLSGGLFRSFGSPFDGFMDHVSVTCGRKRSVGALSQLASGLIKTRFMDLDYCDGCIDGPFGEHELSVVGRRQIVARYAEAEMETQDPAAVVRELEKYKDVRLGRTFLNLEQKLPEPTEEEIGAILRRIDKMPPHRNIDCRACGYPTCRDKAIAVAQGLAEPEICLPYLLEQSEKIYQQLEKSHRELRLSHQELEQAQAQLIRTEKLASLGQLAAGVAHEINNPLGTITIYGHLLLKGLDSDDPRREDAELIVKEANRAKEIVQGLLSFARETKLRPDQTDINELLDEVLGLVENQSLFHNIKTRRLFAQDLPSITADSTQLKQVFLNLILNAAQAMDGKGEITITTIGGKRKIKVKIKDTGPGIPPEIMDKLFSPFFTTKEKGTGLGLAISYGITERHGGRIDVISDLGKGSTFVVSLPVGKEHEENAPRKGGATRLGTRKLRFQENRNEQKNKNLARGR
jgi:signal transduction histidine kinase/NAD-dependent dihydropyrimidine dehydrogenase PreA subunit